MRRLVRRAFACAALAAGAVVIACGGGGGGGPNSIRGTVLVTQPDETWHTEEPCSTSGDFADIHKGGKVRVTDGSGNQIGSGSLAEGRGEEDDNTDVDGSETHICEFTFGIGGLTTTDSYTIVLADRSGVSARYSLDNIRSIFWFVTFDVPPKTTEP